MKARIALLLAAGLLIGGCAPKGCRDDRSSGFALARMGPPQFGQASVAGTVHFEGQPPQMKRIEDAKHCGSIKEEWAVISDDGGLANVLVYLEDAPQSSGEGREMVLLDQVSCRFIPHVTGVQVGQPLMTRNSDLEYHNVAYTPQQNESQNIALETYGRKRSMRFEQPEPEPVRVKCDVHPWMEAYIGVFAHPFFAVTDASGHYVIEKVPAGQYTLKAWHERYGTRQTQITVADAGQVAANFLFARRGS